MNRVRVRPSRRILSPRAYWLIREWSPALLVIGAAVGGYFLLRSILVGGVGGLEYQFGWDIPIAGLLMIVWAVAFFFVVIPPLAVVASVSRPCALVPVLVLPLDVRSTIHFIVAAPLLGVLGAFAPFLIPTALGWDPDIPANLPVGLPMSIGMTLLTVLMVWIFTRSLRHGVALTSTTLIDYGYFRTRRFARHAIARVGFGRVGWLTALAQTVLRNHDEEGCIQLTLADGTQHRLSASLTPVRNLHRGLEIIQAWAEYSEQQSVDNDSAHPGPL